VTVHKAHRISTPGACHVVSVSIRASGSGRIVVDQLLDEFDVERGVLLSDLTGLVEELSREGIVSVKSEP